MFLSTTKAKMKKLNWNKPYIILVTGDTYISFHKCQAWKDKRGQPIETRPLIFKRGMVNC